MRDRDLPNLFIIGAPKCGTTSTFLWLGAHPEICTSKRKETWFFADRELDYLKIQPNHRLDNVVDYLLCFEQVDEVTRVKMEGSTHYLYSETALNFLSRISPKPRLIVQLRNPAKRIWSHFNYIKQQAVGPIDISFTEYVDVLLDKDARLDGTFTQEPWPQHLLENQLSYSNYQHFLSRWHDEFPRDRIRILILEDLARDKLRLIKNVADWIGVNPAYYDDYEFKAKNVTRSLGSERIRRHLRGLARYFPNSVTNAARQITDTALTPFKMKISSSDQSAIFKLEDFFEDLNQRLRSKFNLDLSSWRH